MKNLKKLIAVLLSLMLIFTLFSGCAGNNNENNSQNNNEVTNNNSADNENNSNANNNSNQDNTNDTNNEELPEPGDYELPLIDEEYTISIWCAMNTTISDLGYETFADTPYFQELAKRTGFELDFTHPAIGQEAEALSIMLASGNYPDIIHFTKGSIEYPGGYDAGVDEGVILDVTNLIPQYAPNYNQAIHSKEVILKGVTTDQGRTAGFNAVELGDVQPPWIGNVVRKDWLDDLNLDVPETYDDWYEMLTAFKEEKGAVAPMMLYYTGFTPYDFFNAGYDVGQSFYRVNDEIKYGPLEEGYREYLEMMNKWYDEGLIDQDFPTKKDFLPSADYITTGKAGAWGDIYTLIQLREIQSGNETYELISAPSPKIEEGQTLHLRRVNSNVGDSFYAITTGSEEPKKVMKFIDYSYSPKGADFASFGIEGEHFEYNEEGEPEFNEFMYNNPDGYALAEMISTYCSPPRGGQEYRWYRELAGQPEVNVQALDTWAKDNDGSYVIPSSVTMTAKEGNEYSRIMGDIETFVSEKNMNYIMGQENFDTYDEFLEQLYAMDIERAIEIQQDAYDRYLAR